MGSIRERSAVLTAIAMAIGLGPAAHAADSATLVLSGSVAPTANLSVTPTAAATNLNLGLSQAPMKIAGVLAAANRATGYTVSVVSSNVTTANCTTPCFFSPSTSQSLSYSLYRGTSAVNFTAGGGTFVRTSAKSAASGDSHDANIAYDGSAAGLPAGADYSETLTFSIAVN
ncbi:MAG: hypothetical protein FJX65_10300 [Alphaproteobacteria bacterium]|nr:hypothetical protein [Alphaproteobacteria bacterium]